MAIAKVILNGETQMDVTQKTVTPESMLSGTTALKNDGTDITGTIASKTSSDLTANGATVTAPAGYYASAASKSVASGTAGTPTASKGTVSNHSVSITPSVTNSTGYITGGTKTGTAVTVSASELVSGTKTISASGTTDVTNYESASVASGSAKTPNTTITANPTVSVNSSGLITATVSKTQSVTPTVSAGYVASGTAGTVTVTGSDTNQLPTQGAQTITPSTTDQTIKSLRYLTGDQTILGDANLVPQNIAEGVSIFGVQGSHGAKKYTATITSNGRYNSRDTWCCYVYFNGTRYYTAGETFQFSNGDTAKLKLYGYSSSTQTSVYIDEVLVSDVAGYQTYEYTLPDSDINIELTTSGERISVTTVASGGSAEGFATGTITVESEVAETTDYKITDVDEIGFTPTKFLFLKNVHDKAGVYMAMYVDFGGAYIRPFAVWNGQDNVATITQNYYNWSTKRSSGCLRLYNGEISYEVTSSYKLTAGTYTWYAFA